MLLTLRNKNPAKKKKHTHTRTLAAVAPAEAGSIGSTEPVVWKEETVAFVRDRAQVERTALGIVGGQNEVVEATIFKRLPFSL
jgi:hypothetical protein